MYSLFLNSIGYNLVIEFILRVEGRPVYRRLLACGNVEAPALQVAPGQRAASER
jgi:hypothetical protein